ncbi:MAG: hypothetical protein L0241_27515 [Planctomycetia bacterium]|nr:hypothetical protein [Planctomycetia bacterium]
MNPANPDRLAAHLSVNSYDDFTLTNAIRPGAGLPVRPREGYRLEVFRDRQAKLRLPMLSASVSAERLFETFLALLEPLGEVVHVVLESSHGAKVDSHTDLRRTHIDRAVLASHFCEFEELLTHDGCTGVAVLAANRRPIEVQFDEHKLFHIYAPNLGPFRRVLRDHGVRRRKLLPLICEAEHLHHTTDEFADQFRQLALRIGVGDFDRVFSDESEPEA